MGKGSKQSTHRGRGARGQSPHEKMASLGRHKMSAGTTLRRFSRLAKINKTNCVGCGRWRAATPLAEDGQKQALSFRRAMELSKLNVCTPSLQLHPGNPS